MYNELKLIYIDIQLWSKVIRPLKLLVCVFVATGLTKLQPVDDTALFVVEVVAPWD